MIPASITSPDSAMRKFMDPDGETHDDMRRIKHMYWTLRSFRAAYAFTVESTMHFTLAMDECIAMVKELNELLGRGIPQHLVTQHEKFVYSEITRLIREGKMDPNTGLAI